MTNPAGTPQTRFLDRVDKGDGDGCWLWTGHVTGSGYGRIGHSNAHRESWRLHVGPVPDGLLVLHRCDVKLCVNPAHLFLGTHLDNMADMVAKGRAATGDRNGKALHPDSVVRGERVAGHKLTTAQVIEIRRRHALGASLRDLYLDYGISKSSMWSLVTRASWRHVA